MSFLLPIERLLDIGCGGGGGGDQVFSALKGIHPPRDGVRAHVVVGTPGSIVAALEKRKLLLMHCAVFVLDEADAMLEVICRVPAYSCAPPRLYV